MFWLRRLPNFPDLKPLFLLQLRPRNAYVKLTSSDLCRVSSVAARAFARLPCRLHFLRRSPLRRSPLRQSSFSASRCCSCSCSDSVSSRHSSLHSFSLLFTLPPLGSHSQPQPATRCLAFTELQSAGAEQNDLDSSPGRSLDGSFRKLVRDFLQNGLDASLSQSVNGSFKNSNSVLSSYSFSGTLSSSKFNPVSRKLYKGLKDYRRKLVELEIFHPVPEDWVVENTSVESVCGEPIFPSPSVIDELRTLDLAVEGILFQQLFRMPSSPFNILSVQGFRKNSW